MFNENEEKKEKDEKEALVYFLFHMRSIYDNLQILNRYANSLREESTRPAFDKIMETIKSPNSNPLLFKNLDAAGKYRADNSWKVGSIIVELSIPESQVMDKPDQKEMIELKNETLNNLTTNNINKLYFDMPLTISGKEQYSIDNPVNRLKILNTILKNWPNIEPGNIPKGITQLKNIVDSNEPVQTKWSLIKKVTAPHFDFFGFFGDSPKMKQFYQAINEEDTQKLKSFWEQHSKTKSVTTPDKELKSDASDYKNRL